jgi:hypothetical protein
MDLSSLRLAAAFACAAFLPVLAQDLPKAETLMDKYIEVTGGKAAHEKVKNYVMSGTFDMAAQGVSAKMTIWRAEGKSLAQIDIQGMGVIEEGYDGTVAWSKNPMQGARLKEGGEKEMAAYGAEVNPDLNWRNLYSSVQTGAAEDVKGAACYRVDLTTKSGQKMERWFDQKSGLLVKTRMTMSSPQGEIPIEAFVSEYKVVEGVNTPHKIVQSVMGNDMTLAFSSIQVNQSIDPAKFALPEDVKALAAKK